MMRKIHKGRVDTVGVRQTLPIGMKTSCWDTGERMDGVNKSGMYQSLGRTLRGVSPCPTFNTNPSDQPV